jgi:uncharacterized protein (DUF2147 family)
MRNSIRALLVTFALAGLSCGSNDKDLSKFVGVWGQPAGTYTIMCTGLGTSTTQVTGTETWSTSSTSDLVQTIPDTTCVFHANASASTASGVSGQSCVINATTTNGIAYTETMNFTSYTFVVSPDGKTATENFAGNATDNAAGVTYSCTFTQTASYTKQ